MSGAGVFSRCGTIEEITDEMLGYQTFHTPPSQKDRQGLIDLLTQHALIIEEYIAGIKRPALSVKSLLGAVSGNRN